MLKPETLEFSDLMTGSNRLGAGKLMRSRFVLMSLVSG